MKIQAITVATILFLSCGCTSQTAVQPKRDYTDTKTQSKRDSLTINPLREIVENAETVNDFDDLYDLLKNIPRIKDEFETTQQFKERQNKKIASIGDKFLVPTPVDMKHVKYDADNQVLNIEIWAFQNYSTSKEELGSAIGFNSDLSRKHNIHVEHDIGFDRNVIWSYKREEKNVGQYVATNAFGADVNVTKQVAVTRAIFDRDGRGMEHVWGTEDDFRFTISDEFKTAFALNLAPDKAKTMKANGIKAAVLVSPKFPFFSNGTTHMSPTRNLPIERNTDVRIVIADIQALVLYESNGNILAVKKTN